MRILFIAIYILLNLLVLIRCFFELITFIGESAEAKINNDKSYKFKWKRYHILALIIFPIAFVIFLFIILFFILMWFIVWILKVTFDWLNKPIKNIEK